MIQQKLRHRNEDESAKPLAYCRIEELERMKMTFFGFDPSYHIARYKLNVVQQQFMKTETKDGLSMTVTELY